ncbi:alpha/beta hydrolase [Nonomuraea rhizosphaerae]|uniref:alpha/beta hydrolase n=1 Tax=Nonomuraea rhizosphaerae TaxID=2665663 RepID=UPI001C5ED220|nr:alpha/beta hydrolase [Nonomuraea rhizosphaerae]
MSPRVAAAAVAATALLTSACTPATTPPPPSASTLTWSDCEAAPGFECAELTVPLDHDRPGGSKITLSAVRLPATGDRIGSLVVNPGGPGGSGINYALAARSIVSRPVREHFDIVGFDPRGVGSSTPVKCLDDQALDAFVALDTTPDDPQEQAALEKASRDFANGCQSRAADLLPHLGTVDAARDLESLRQALGDEKLTYLGKSYGTFLGAVYADLYPGKVRALVLDGAVNPALPRMTHNADQATAFERALRAYVKSCLATPACPFHSRTPDGALSEITTLLQNTDGKPLPAGDRQTTESLATLGALTPLYDRRSWPTLTETFRQALNGDGALLLANADQLMGRRDDGTYSNQTEANLAINCMDSAYPKAVSTYATAARDTARTAPRFGPYIMWSSLPCAYWPATPTFTHHPLTAKGAAPILVIGTERDPATPYEWAQALAEQLDSGTFLGYDGDGHTAYFTGSACVDAAVDTYLLTTTPPKDGTVCPGGG